MGRFSKDLERLAEFVPVEETKVTEPVPQQSQAMPSKDYATTTATNEPQRRDEAKKAGKEAFAEERFGDAVKGAAYGAARGLTLGAVDRAVGLGTHIGEQLASSDETPPADPSAYQSGRMEYLNSEDKARENAPWSYAGGSIAGGIVPSAAMTPLSIAAKLQAAKPLTQWGGRLADAGIQGGVAGGFNTESDKAGDIAEGALGGAAIGAGAQGTLGELVRRAINLAPKKEINRTIREIVESDAGSATPTARHQMVTDIKDVTERLEVDDALRRAMRLPAEEAKKVLQTRLDKAGAGKADNYKAVDNAFGKKDQFTDVKLLQELVDVEQFANKRNLPLVISAMKQVRDDVRNVWGPTWALEQGKTYSPGKAIPITTKQLREFITSTQGSAAKAMGSINGTVASEVPTEVAGLAKKILENRLDRAAEKGAAAEVAAIRESDRQTSAYLHMKKNLDQRGIKETLQEVGLGKKLEGAGARAENAAALGLLATGNVQAAAAVKARGPVSKAYNLTAREVNDRILAPLKRAADEGKTWAEMTKFAAEIGAPLSFARYFHDRATSEDKRPAPRRSDYNVDTRTK